MFQQEKMIKVRKKEKIAEVHCRITTHKKDFPKPRQKWREALKIIFLCCDSNVFLRVDRYFQKILIFCVGLWSVLCIVPCKQ